MNLIMSKVGIIGLGFMGATHLKAWLQCDGACIVARMRPGHGG